MMNKNYIIRWKSKVNGRSGRGTKLFARDEAEQLVDELNTQYPDIEHELAEPDDQPLNRVAQASSRATDADEVSNPPSETSHVLSFQE